TPLLRSLPWIGWCGRKGHGVGEGGHRVGELGLVHHPTGGIEQDHTVAVRAVDGGPAERPGRGHSTDRRQGPRKGLAGTWRGAMDGSLLQPARHTEGEEQSCGGGRKRDPVPPPSSDCREFGSRFRPPPQLCSSPSVCWVSY